MLYRADQLIQLESEQSTLFRNIEELKSRLLCIFVQRLSSKRAIENIQHGVCRRLCVIKRSAENIISIFPPSREDRLRRTELDDVEINLHALLINVYGILDNLAWVYVFEHDIKELLGSPAKVGLFKKDVQAYLAPELIEYLNSDRIKNWYEKYAKNYRDALAHRIPLYVPPFSLTDEESVKYRELDEQAKEHMFAHDFDSMKELEAERDKLGTISNAYMHSFLEANSRPVALHPQIIADGITVFEITELFQKTFQYPKIEMHQS